MITKWLHINTSSFGDPFILPIWKAVKDAEDSKKIKRLNPDTYKLGIPISNRLDILPRIVDRINSGVAKIYKEAGNHKEENIYSESKEGCVLTMDSDLVYSLLADIDSILFELKSVCELMTNLFVNLYEHVGRPINNDCAGLKIKSVIGEAGNDTSWFNELNSHRNFFMHEGTPSLAIDISNAPEKYDLLIMRENIKLFNDNSNFLKLSEVDKIVKGFVSAKPVIQQHLINLFRELSFDS